MAMAQDITGKNGLLIQRENQLLSVSGVLHRVQRSYAIYQRLCR